MGLFGSAVAVAFQSVYRAEIYQNDIFFIFKKLFLKSAHQNDIKTPKYIHLKYKKNNQISAKNRWDRNDKRAHSP